MSHNKPKPNILIVEDVNSDIDILNHILKDEYTLYIAKSGETALTTVTEVCPDLILLDIILPDITGFTVLEKLKEESRTWDIPVIVITGINSAKSEEKGLALGAVDYITKPFHNTVVRARIKTHIKIVQYLRTIEELGVVDHLTGLPNLQGFEERLGMEFARAAREKVSLSLLIVDLDDFQMYNQKHGYPTGDAMLRDIAMSISGSLKRPADMAARLQGDRFIVLLPDTDAEGANIVAEEIRTKIANSSVPHEKSKMKTTCTASLGVLVKRPEPGQSWEKIISETENLLASAPKDAKNHILRG